MNKLSKASIVPHRELSFHNETTFAGYDLPYPILAVRKCAYDVKVNKLGDYSEADYTIKATLRVEDSRDATPFDKKIAFEEKADLLNEEDTAGEGFIVTGGDVDLDELALRLILSSLPIRLTRDEAGLPKSGKGFRVLSEEEKKKEDEEKPNPVFNGLPEYPDKK